MPLETTPFFVKMFYLRFAQSPKARLGGGGSAPHAEPHWACGLALAIREAARCSLPPSWCPHSVRFDAALFGVHRNRSAGCCGLECLQVRASRWQSGRISLIQDVRLGYVRLVKVLGKMWPRFPGEKRAPSYSCKAMADLVAFFFLSMERGLDLHGPHSQASLRGTPQGYTVPEEGVLSSSDAL